MKVLKGRVTKSIDKAYYSKDNITLINNAKKKKKKKEIEFGFSRGG